MPSKRRIVELLSRDELIPAVERFDLAVPNRRVRSQLIDALVRSRKAALADILEPLSRDRLKHLCRELGLDDRGRSKAELVARLLGTPERTSSPAPTQVTQRPAEAAYTPRLLSEVTLHSFKAAYEPGPIPLQPFNVIIGRNGSGKSTLLEALQWIDTAIRRDAREASDRYHGVRDLVNLRSRSAVPSFRLTLTWGPGGNGTYSFRYNVQVQDERGVARITAESLIPHDKPVRDSTLAFILTRERGERLVVVEPEAGAREAVLMKEPDRLALAWVNNIRTADPAHSPGFLSEFWKRAVFLRLSPNRLQEGSPATRRSFEPLLDEEGQNLPALINELDDTQRAALVDAIREILPGIRDVTVSSAEHGRETQVHYSLLEEMNFPGLGGKKPFPIPAWMLSEGTRRITAILALLVRDPPPTLLCIEEIENGLDPWTVKAILRHLQDAAGRGTQVLLTTHSPWLLDDVPMDSILLVRRRGGDTQYEHFASLPEVREYDDSVPAGTRYVHLDQERE
jgi:predicted ATPase